MPPARDDDTLSERPTLGRTEPEKEEPAGRDWAWSEEDAERETLDRPADSGEAGVMTLVGRYKVLRRLGEGGMGSVWLAEDLKLDGRRVAIKMLPAVLAGKKTAFRQVKQEALMAMKLAHPNIATVRAFEEEEGGSPFLVMDYIDGEGLDDILAEKGKLSEEETVRLLAPVAAALDYAHAQGVVHRDVKPGNIIVRKDGTPFILDFGIAREIQETMTRVTGKISSGTLMYMSPEQLHGRAPKAAQDVYSFAAMAYECLSGQPPFSRGQIEYQIDHDAPEPLEEGVAGRALRGGILVGLAKDPEKRPGSCAGVLGRDEAAKREREKREAEEVRRKREEEALRARERARVEEAQRRKREESERLARERARAEEERRRVTAALEAERAARKEAEAAAREARRRAQAEQLEAQQAQEARGRAAGWAWFLAIVLVLGGLVAYGVWQQEHETTQAKLLQLQRDAADQRKAANDVQQALNRQKAEAQRKAAEDAQRKPQAEPQRQVQRGTWDGSYRGEARDVSLPDGKMMRLHWCPEGSFTMGSPSTEEGRDLDEVPHEVTLTRGFWMAETEVTQGQWKALMNGETVADLARKGLQDDTGYDRNDGKGAITMRERWGLERNSNPMSRCCDLDDGVPVYNVSWGEAKEFCRRLTEKGRNEGWLPAGYSFRLPTEAEWEYACRAGTKTALPNGKDIRILGQHNAPALDGIAWYGGNSSVGFTGSGWNTENWPEKQEPGGLAGPRMVHTKGGNAWGLHDMIGNVYEWCEDEYASYPTGTVTDYCNSNSSGALGVHRVLRGGAWNFNARNCRSAYRNWRPAGYRYIGVGFRPVCSAGSVQ